MPHPKRLLPSNFNPNHSMTAITHTKGYRKVLESSYRKKQLLMPLCGKDDPREAKFQNKAREPRRDEVGERATLI
jgi:hypothetical protein